MPRKTHFQTEFDSKDKPVTLFCVISPDNPKQHGECFLEFVRMVNERTTREIAHVTIIDGSYLNRHYKLKYADHENQKIVFEWRNANLKFIEQLQIPYTVTSWYQLISSGAYEATHRKIIEMFNDEADESFKRTVINLAYQYSSYKGTQKQCVQYLLEECAGALLIDGYLTYPGDLNEAIVYAIKKLELGPKFIPYILGKIYQQTQPPKVIPDSSISPLAVAASALLPFFTLPSERRTTPFPNKMIFHKENHVWSVECEIQFFDEARETAIRFLLENIQEAQNEYMREKERHPYPLIFEYKKQSIAYLISYKIEIKNKYVLETINPFSILISATKLENDSREISEPSHAPTP